MPRSSLVALSLFTLAAACGPKGTEAKGPADDLDTEADPADPGDDNGAVPVAEPRDQDVREGGSWTRLEPGTWEFSPFDQPVSARSLSAEVGGRGILVVDIPDGASGGMLTTVRAHFTHAGTARWVVYPHTGKDGGLDGEPLGSTEITVAAAQTSKVGAEAIWTDATFDPPIAIDAKKFHLSFEVVEGQPAVAADNGKSKRVFYQGPKDKKPAATPFSAHVKVVLSDVH